MMASSWDMTKTFPEGAPLAAAKMEKLAYAFMTEDRSVNLDAFSKQIQAISYERNEQIVSSDSDRRQSKTPQSPF
jgi:hypothetical protein